MTMFIHHKNVNTFVGVFVFCASLSPLMAAEADDGASALPAQTVLPAQMVLTQTLTRSIAPHHNISHDINGDTHKNAHNPNNIPIGTDDNTSNSDNAITLNNSVDDNHTATQADHLNQANNILNQANNITNESRANNHTNKNSNTGNFDPAVLRSLAQHKQWRHMLFFQDGKAEVISGNFYLTDPAASTKRVNFSPYDELIATVNAKDDPAVVCQFPARYFWLQHKLGLAMDLSACKDLPSKNQDISLILIGSYLKNPASTFGHVLVNTKERDTDNTPSSQDLLTQSYNFGARIPNNENGVMYAVKGLFGFYNAGFAKADFYHQDTAYSKNEQRDMWEYTLDLDDFDRILLNYHLYEASQARFTYYFIKQNCGYRSGEILELVSDMPMTERIGGWYAPDFVFNQLTEHQNGALIKSVRYLPSEQTALRQRFRQLSSTQQTLINDIITTQDISLLDNQPFTQSERTLILDFLLAHRNYKLSQAKKSEQPQHEQFKKQLIARRIVLPAGNAYNALPISDKPSPALSNKTALTQIAINNHGLSLGGSMFIKDPLNSYTDLDKRFEAINLTVGYDFDNHDKHTNHKPYLQNFTFLHIQQIENLKEALADEPWLSWQLKAGARQDPFDGTHHRAYAMAGAGVGALLSDSWLMYGLGNAVLQDKQGKLDGVLELGLRYKNPARPHQAMQLDYQNHHRQGSSPLHLVNLTLRQGINKNNDVRLSLSQRWHSGNHGNSNDNDSQVGVSWQHYW